MSNTFPAVALRFLLTFVLVPMMVVFVTVVADEGKNKPAVVLLKVYDETQDYSGWLMSEKLDGMRAIWNGKQFLSKGGKEIHAPQWFIELLPNFGIDGELWTKRDNFENIVSIVRGQPVDEQWQHISYNIFEVMPNNDFVDGGLLSRLNHLREFLQDDSLAVGQSAKLGVSKFIKIIEQKLVKNNQHLQDELQRVLTLKGEGLVLRMPNQPYQTGRSKSALKVKKHQEAECVVMSHTEGKGKFSQMMGSLSCEMTNGQIIKIGTGFTNQERQSPPPIGTTITFKYYGFTAKGIPKFATFLRIREDNSFQ